MKNYIIIFGVCLMLCGCGCSKKTVSPKVQESAIGSEDVSYSLKIVCGDKEKESTIILNKDKKASYNLYECNNEILQLTSGSGTYSISGSLVTIIGSYKEKIEISVKNSDTIEIKNGTLRQTLSK